FPTAILPKVRSGTCGKFCLFRGWKVILQAAVQAIAALRAGTWTVHALQDHFPASEEAELSASS
ncbi:MAG: hypothetical protein AAFR78_08405, partial [Planctomycetota bacterium]